MQEAHALAEDEWLTPWLWTGLVRTLGAPWFCLVGSPVDVAEGLMAFKAAGISQFILSGSPTGEEMLRFGADVLPLVREAKDEIGVHPLSSARICPGERTPGYVGGEAAPEDRAGIG
jgi:hypothetical protein